MRLLMCSAHPLVRELGAPKVLIELSQALRACGAQCELIAPADYGSTAGQGRQTRIDRSQKLRTHLRAGAARYDVIEYDHEELPYPRGDFDPRVLMVARSVLLVDHLHHVPLGWLRRLRSAPQRRARVRRAAATLSAADLINVSNEHDRDTLVQQGHAPQRIVVLPFGLSASRRQAFEEACREAPPDGARRIAFVGTFDYRKGGRDFPRLAAMLCAAHPGARLRLLGTGGLLPTKHDVLRRFPRALRDRLEIVPRFEPQELPRLLAGCAAGVFPSYYEGFGFGVLEMLAAAMPVVAYDAPGPASILPREWLVSRGDAAAMAAKVIQLLHPDRLASERSRARRMAARFDWHQIAERTLEAYRAAIQRRGEP